MTTNAVWGGLLAAGVVAVGVGGYMLRQQGEPGPAIDGGAAENVPLAGTTSTPTPAPVPAPVAVATPDVPTAPLAGPLPTLDVVRVDAAGAAIVAGTGPAASKMTLLLDGEQVAMSQTDGQGNFVALFDIPTADLARVLTVESEDADGTITRAAESIIVAPVFPAAPEVADIPEVTTRSVADAAPVTDGGDASSIAEPEGDLVTSVDVAAPPQDAVPADVVVVQTDPDRTAKVVIAQADAGVVERLQEAPSAAEEIAVESQITVEADPVESTTPIQPAALAATVPISDTETPVATVAAANEPVVELAEVPDAGKPQPIESVIVETPAEPLVTAATRPPVAPAISAPGPAEPADVATTLSPPAVPETIAPPAPAAAAVQVASAPVPPRLFRVGPGGVTVISDPPAAQPEVIEDLGIDAISYDAAGDVQLTGRGSGDAELRIYLDNRPVQTVRVGEGGAWSSPLPNVDSGVYTLRIDELGTDGTVISRVETPFQRTAPDIARQARRDGLTAITVQPGYTLWAISEGYFGNGVQYVQIFEANRSLIRDPDLIYPGQVFALPADGDSSTGN